MAADGTILNEFLILSRRQVGKYDDFLAAAVAGVRCVAFHYVRALITRDTNSNATQSGLQLKGIIGAHPPCSKVNLEFSTGVQPHPDTARVKMVENGASEWTRPISPNSNLMLWIDARPSLSTWRNRRNRFTPPNELAICHFPEQLGLCQRAPSNRSEREFSSHSVNPTTLHFMKRKYLRKKSRPRARLAKLWAIVFTPKGNAFFAAPRWLQDILVK